MDVFLTLSRQAFRSLHGLSPDRKAVSLPKATEARWRRWARRHRMLGLLHAGLPEAGAAWASAAYGQAQHSARLTHEAERLVAALSPSLPTLSLVKGPALAMQAWPAPGLRSFDDLDFQCDRSDYSNLMTGMLEAGYVPEIEEARRRAHLWHYGWGITFHHPDGFMVEVNHRMFPPHYPWPRRLTPRPRALFVEEVLETSPVRMPTPAMHLLVCCLHAIWHGWARLAWLVDIAGLLVRHPDAAIQAKNLAASSPFARQALMEGGGIAASLFGADLTGERIPPATGPVLKQARSILAGSTRRMSGGELRHFHEQFMTSREKAVYRSHRICTPGDGDFQWVSLPVALRGLYWTLRPVRGLLYGKTGY